MKMIIKLPFRHTRKSDIISKQRNLNNGRNSSLTLRSRKLREKVKSDPKKLEAYRKRKKEENKKYKAKLKQSRKEDINIDEDMKTKQREWKRKSRKQLVDAKKVSEEKSESK